MITHLPFLSSHWCFDPDVIHISSLDRFNAWECMRCSRTFLIISFDFVGTCSLGTDQGIMWRRVCTAQPRNVWAAACSCNSWSSQRKKGVHLVFGASMSVISAKEETKYGHIISIEWIKVQVCISYKSLTKVYGYLLMIGRWRSPAIFVGVFQSIFPRSRNVAHVIPPTHSCLNTVEWLQGSSTSALEIPLVTTS